MLKRRWTYCMILEQLIHNWNIFWNRFLAACLECGFHVTQPLGQFVQKMGVGLTDVEAVPQSLPSLTGQVLHFDPSCLKNRQPVLQSWNGIGMGTLLDVFS